MTKDEFIQKQKEFSRKETRVLWVFFVFICGLVALFAIGGKSVLNNPEVENFLMSLVTVNRHLLLAGMGLLVVIILAAFLAVARNPGGMKCPNCGESIRGYGSRITLLTSNCGLCGERIIS